MKNTFLLFLAFFMLVSCYPKDISASSPSLISSGYGSSNSNTDSGSSSGSKSSNTSHYCGYRTKKGTPCKRIVSGTSGYCWQHR